VERIGKLKFSLPVIGDSKEIKGFQSIALDREKAEWSLLALKIQKSCVLFFKQVEKEVGST